MVKESETDDYIRAVFCRNNLIRFYARQRVVLIARLKLTIVRSCLSVGPSVCLSNPDALSKRCKL